MNQQQQQFALQQQQQQEYLFYQLMMRHQAALQAQQASLAAAGASGMRPGGSGMAGLPPVVTSQPMAAEALNMSFPSSSYPSPMAWAAPPAMPMTPRMVAALLGPGAGGGGADEHGGGAGAASAGSGSGSGMDMHGGVGMGGVGVGVGVGAGMGVGMGGMGTGRVPASSGDVTSVASTASGSLMSPHIAHGVPTPRMSTMGGVSSVNVGSYPQQVSHAMRGASMHGLSRGFGAGSVSAPSSVSTPATVAASAPGSAVMPAAPGRPGMRPPPVLTSLLPPAVARTRLSSTMRTPTAASVGIDVPSIGIGPEEFRNSIKKVRAYPHAPVPCVPGRALVQCCVSLCLCRVVLVLVQQLRVAWCCHRLCCFACCSVWQFTVVVVLASCAMFCSFRCPRPPPHTDTHRTPTPNSNTEHQATRS